MVGFIFPNCFADQLQPTQSEIKEVRDRNGTMQTHEMKMPGEGRQKKFHKEFHSQKNFTANSKRKARSHHPSPRAEGYRDGNTERREAACRACQLKEDVGQDLWLPEAEGERIVTEKLPLPLLECAGRERRQ